jgi:hypothetical protein
MRSVRIVVKKSIPLTKSGKNKPWATATLTIKNHRTGETWKSPGTMKAFIDSGASISIIPPEAVPILKDQVGHFDSAPAKVQTANGMKDAIALKNVSLCLNEICYRGNVLVTDSIGADLLVGADFLRASHCAIDFGHPAMTCKGKKIPFTMES